MIYANDPEYLLGYIGSSVLVRFKNNKTSEIVLLLVHNTSILSMEDLIFTLLWIEITNPFLASNYTFELNKNEEINEYEVNFTLNDKILKTVK